jgi:dipeptide transport system ATP-binding protein
MALLEINNLNVEFGISSLGFRAVDEFDLTVEEGEVVGVVGESGSGKSVSMLSIMGLIDYPGRVSAERLLLAGHDLLALSPAQRRKLTGHDVAMIFQEPMSSLNPCYTVAFQIMEALRVHEGGTKEERRRRTIDLLAQVGIPAPESRLPSFPHQLSGGMNQRVMIAMAIACQPKLLIADEPTTALDVTIQAQILRLLLQIQRDRGMALILITHDMGVIAETAQRVVVMYAGQIVERRPVEALFAAPRHPYTAALLESLPERGEGRRRLPTIPGVVPGPYDRPTGCLFHPRCPRARERCRKDQPALTPDAGGAVRCFYPVDGGEGSP